MHIRRATMQDAALLARLNIPIQQLHVDAMPSRFKVPQPHDPALIAFYEERLATEDWVGYVVENDADAMGYILCMIRRSPDNPFVYAETTLLVDQISVKPEYKRRGCGQMLMQAAFELAREVQAARIELNVWDFNHSAQAFYQALGFRSIHHRMQWVLGKSEL
jgi:ribosomal protein S18 acetylase RimI-like enzyme